MKIRHFVFACWHHSSIIPALVPLGVSILARWFECRATKYCLIRSAELSIDQNHGAGVRRYEPVPDATPLRGPILPDNFPSSYAKAKAQTAQGLKKAESDLTFAEILKFFEKKKSNAEVAK